MIESGHLRLKSLTEWWPANEFDRGHRMVNLQEL